jgi:hypothetical protein
VSGRSGRRGSAPLWATPREKHQGFERRRPLRTSPFCVPRSRRVSRGQERHCDDPPAVAHDEHPTGELSRLDQLVSVARGDAIARQAAATSRVAGPAASSARVGGVVTPHPPAQRAGPSALRPCRSEAVRRPCSAGSSPKRRAGVFRAPSAQPLRQRLYVREPPGFHCPPP